MRSSVSIALFFLLSAFFLFALLAALQHSGKALGISLGCLAGLVVIIIFLTPVRLPGLPEWMHLNGWATTTTTVSGETATSLPPKTTTTVMDDTAASLPPRTTATTRAGVTTTTGSASGTTTTAAAR